jgi:hypothetical protein
MRRCGIELVFHQDGWSALSIAAEKGQTGIVRMLLEAGASKDLKTKVCLHVWVSVFVWPRINQLING